MPSPGPVRLDRLDWLTPALENLLHAHRRLFAAANSDDIRRESWAHDLAETLQRAALKRGIVAYHFTREAEPGEISSGGLRILDGDRHRARFLERFGGLFSQEQHEQIRLRWRQYFEDPMQKGAREGRVHFVLCCYPPHHGDVEFLLRYYGGEAVNMPLTDDPDIGRVLKAIGRPVIVHARIDPRHFVSHNHDYPFGLSALYAWHRSIMPKAGFNTAQGYSTVSIPAGDILEVQDAGAWLRPTEDIHR